MSLTSTEQKIVEKLVRKALNAGYLISVNNGEEFTVKRSSELTVILEALATTDSDILHFTLDDGIRIGWIQLRWGNDEDLISDYSDNADMAELVAGLQKSQGKNRESYQIFFQ